MVLMLPSELGAWGLMDAASKTVEGAASRGFGAVDCAAPLCATTSRQAAVSSVDVLRREIRDAMHSVICIVLR
jgi:hypothetical protein